MCLELVFIHGHLHLWIHHHLPLHHHLLLLLNHLLLHPLSILSTIHCLLLLSIKIVKASCISLIHGTRHHNLVLRM